MYSAILLLTGVPMGVVYTGCNVQSELNGLKRTKMDSAIIEQL